MRNFIAFIKAHTVTMLFGAFSSGVALLGLALLFPMILGLVKVLVTIIAIAAFILLLVYSVTTILVVIALLCFPFLGNSQRTIDFTYGAEVFSSMGEYVEYNRELGVALLSPRNDSIGVILLFQGEYTPLKTHKKEVEVITSPRGNIKYFFSVYNEMLIKTSIYPNQKVRIELYEIHTLAPIGAMVFKK